MGGMMDIFGSEKNLNKWYADHEAQRAQEERPGDTMSTHTPEPWKVKGRYYGQQFRAETIEPNICEMSSSLPPEEVSNNAAFIVRACNSHKAMLEALKAACQDIRLAAEIHKAKGLEAASHELRTHEQIYQNVIRLAEGRT